MSSAPQNFRNRVKSALQYLGSAIAIVVPILNYYYSGQAWVSIIFVLIGVVIVCCSRTLEQVGPNRMGDHPETQRLIDPDTLTTQLKNFVVHVVTGQIKHALEHDVLFGKRWSSCKGDYGFKASRFLDLTPDLIQGLKGVHQQVNPDNVKDIVTNLIAKWELLVDLPQSRAAIIRQAEPDILRLIQSLVTPLDTIVLSQSPTSEEDSDNE